MLNAPMSRRSLLGSVAAVAAASVPGAAAAMNGLAAVTDNPDAELYKSSDIEVLRGLEAVRRRPAMYIGADELRAGLLEWVVNDIACERPQEIRILLWRKDAFTIAYDGRPLPTSRLVSRSTASLIRPSTSHSCIWSLGHGIQSCRTSRS